MTPGHAIGVVSLIRGAFRSGVEPACNRSAASLRQRERGGEEFVTVSDEAAFERYVRARGQALARTAAFLVADVHLGEDLLQDVLSRMAPRWAVVRQADDLDAYVHRALVNTATSWRRRRSWHETPTERLPDHATAGPSYDDTVLRALRALPPRQRAVVVARHYLDRTEQQTAELLGCSVGTVKSQHSKAIAKLRVLLTDVQERA
jgi:RNA polymerase sigma-70 factor (sigma-E family)